MSALSLVKLSELVWAYEMKRLATENTHVAVRASPEPTYSATMMESFSKELKCTESSSKASGFSLHGIYPQMIHRRGQRYSSSTCGPAVNWGPTKEETK